MNKLNLKGFKKEDGPFVHALDQALATFNARRQVYHGGAFAGNDVHRSLMVNECTIDSLPVILLSCRLKTSSFCAIH